MDGWDDDYCYECRDYGDDYYYNEDGELVCRCEGCHYNESNRDNAWDWQEVAIDEENMDEETIQKKLGRHFGIDYRYVVVPNILMYGNGGMYEADFIYINKKNFLTEVEIKISFNDFKADFNKKVFHNSKHVRSFYYALPWEMWKSHSEYITQKAKEVGAGVIVVSDSLCVTVRPKLRDVQPLTDGELKDYMRIGCLKWCR